MTFTANLYQLTATVEGVTKSIFLLVWFNAGAFLLLVFAGLACMVGSRKDQKVTRIFLVSVFLASMSMAVFAYGLTSSDFAVESLNPGYAISKFPDGSFGLSAEESMQFSYHYSWEIGIGFWLALATAVLALVSAYLSKKINLKVNASK